MRRPSSAVAAAVALPGAAQAAGRCGDHPWCDRSKSADARAGLLLPQLTLDEKLDLMGGDVDGILHPETSSSTVNGIAAPRRAAADRERRAGRDQAGHRRREQARPPRCPRRWRSGPASTSTWPPATRGVIAGEAKAPRPRPRARTDRQPRARPARRAHLRELRRGPAAAERLRASPGSARLQGAGVIARREALRRQQPGDRTASPSTRSSTSARCARSTSRISRRR